MNSALEQYRQTVSLIGGQFGDSCQAILYDIHNSGGKSGGSVIAVCGHMADAKAGDPLPDFLVHYIADHGYRNQYGFVNKEYPGLVLRSSLQFISENDQAVCGCLCVHHNIVHIQMMSHFLENLLRPADNPPDLSDESPERDGDTKTYSAPDVQGFLENVISEFLVERLGSNSFASLDKPDKLALISELNNRGIFLVKGAVNLVAKRMNISKFSIYNYLDEIRAEG